MTNHAASELFTFAQKARYWNDLYEHPASLFEHHMRRRRDYAWHYVASHFDRPISLLDLGCGAGVLSEKLIESGYAVTAADASPDMIALTRDRLKRFPPASHRLVQANCLSLPFADGEFDLVVCLGMFGYFDEVSRALSEIRRVLKPGGTLIISVRNKHTQYLFDLFQLLKHPFRLLRALLRRLVGRPRQTTEAPGGDDGFRIDIYQVPARLIAGVTERGYRLTEFDGLGYGPLTFAQRKFFSEPWSIKLSDILERGLRAAGLGKLGRWVADVSFYVFRRS